MSSGAYPTVATVRQVPACSLDRCQCPSQKFAKSCHHVIKTVKGGLISPSIKFIAKLSKRRIQKVHCGKILQPIWVVLPPSTQLSWYHQPDKVGGSLNSVPAYLDRVLPARSTGTYVPAYWDGGLPVRSTGTVHQLAWMGGYQSDQPELCTGLLG